MTHYLLILFLFRYCTIVLSEESCETSRKGIHPRGKHRSRHTERVYMCFSHATSTNFLHEISNFKIENFEIKTVCNVSTFFYLILQ
ncbi:hypothetical protein ANTRET_LOCUS1753 [Anthophora retusa]